MPAARWSASPYQSRDRLHVACHGNSLCRHNDCTGTVNLVAIAGSANSIPNGTLQIVAGGIQAYPTAVSGGTAYIPNAIAFGIGNTPSQVTITGTNNIVFTGNVALNGPVGAKANLTIDNTGNTVFGGAGIISSTNAVVLTKFGAGTLTLASTNNNTYTGQTILAAGTVNIQQAQSLGGTAPCLHIVASARPCRFRYLLREPWLRRKTCPAGGTVQNLFGREYLPAASP